MVFVITPHLQKKKSLEKENVMILPAVLKMSLCFEQIWCKMFLEKHPSPDIYKEYSQVESFLHVVKLSTIVQSPIPKSTHLNLTFEER